MRDALKLLSQDFPVIERLWSMNLPVVSPGFIHLSNISNVLFSHFPAVASAQKFLYMPSVKETLQF